jgi:hypothetical protein
MGFFELFKAAPREGGRSLPGCPAPPVAARLPPGHLLLPFQSRWVNETSRLKTAEKARQIGCPCEPIFL